MKKILIGLIVLLSFILLNNDANAGRLVKYKITYDLISLEKIDSIHGESEAGFLGTGPGEIDSGEYKVYFCVRNHDGEMQFVKTNLVKILLKTTKEQPYAMLECWGDAKQPEKYVIPNGACWVEWILYTPEGLIESSYKI